MLPVPGAGLSTNGDADAGVEDDKEDTTDDGADERTDAHAGAVWNTAGRSVVGASMQSHPPTVHERRRRGAASNAPTEQASESECDRPRVAGANKGLLLTSRRAEAMLERASLPLVWEEDVEDVKSDALRV